MQPPQPPMFNGSAPPQPPMFNGAAPPQPFNAAVPPPQPPMFNTAAPPPQPPMFNTAVAPPQPPQFAPYGAQPPLQSEPAAAAIPPYGASAFPTPYTQLVQGGGASTAVPPPILPPLQQQQLYSYQQQQQPPHVAPQQPPQCSVPPMMQPLPVQPVSYQPQQQLQQQGGGAVQADAPQYFQQPPPAMQQQQQYQQQYQQQQQQQQMMPPPQQQQAFYSMGTAQPPTAQPPATPTGQVLQPGASNTSFGGGGGGNRTPPPTSGAPGTPSMAPGQKPQRSRPAQTNRRIDPSQVPSPCRDLPQDTAGTSRPRYSTSKAYPPLSVTGFVAVDDGNANPKCYRPTMNCVPHEDSFVKESGVHLGAIIAPLAHLQPEEAIPVVSGRPPVRCKRCRAYISPHTQFTQLGRNWTCCFCEMSNDVSTEYFCNLDGNNRRRDVLEKLELSRGSVEFDVQGQEEYAMKNEKGEVIPTRPMHHLFVLDISRSAQRSLADLADSLRNSISQMDPRCRISFVTYASTLHFYHFKHPQVPQLVVADIDAPFVPLPYNLLCWMNVEEDIERIYAFLDRLPSLSEAADETDCCMGAAVKVASIILSENGGRVILTGHKAPSTGCGALKLREQHKIYGTDKEKELLRPMDGFWTSTALECAKKQISFDLLMFAEEYCELITLGQLCHLTNGSENLFINYNGSEDRLRLQAALDSCLLQEAGYAAILRVRCSNGLRVKGYRGHYLSQDPHDMDLATVQSSSTFLVDFVHESKLDIKSNAYFQCAMLYTTRTGQRRVRVHTLKLPVSNTYANLYKNCDLEANAFTTVQDCLFDAVNKGPKAARDAAVERITKLLTSYRKYCSSGSHSSQLLMPELLKLLPIYTLCILKSDALSVGTSTRIDQRVQCLFDLMGMPPHRLLHFLYPRMYAVHNLLSHQTAGTINPQTGLCYLPTMQQLTAETIMSHGIYVLHDQQARLVYLWIGTQVSPKVANGLFGVDDAAQVGTAVTIEEFHERLRNLLHAVMLNDTGSMDRLLIVHEREAAEESFFRNMLEDENIPGSQSYSDMLCLLHKSINTRLS